MTFRYLGIPSETPLPDRLALRMLVQTFRPELMDRLVDKAERRERRRRLLPARLMMYFALAMWLFGTSSYEEVLAKLTGGLPEMFQDAGDLASAAAIARARMRLGVEPLKELCAHVAASAGQPGPPGTERVFAFESVAMEVPDTPANRAAYVLPGVDGEATGEATGDGERGDGADRGDRTRRPTKGRALDVWLVSLTECRMCLSVASAIAPSPELGIEGIIAEWPHDLLGAGALVVGEREAVPTAMWNALAAAGAHQIWRLDGRTDTARPLPVVRALPDGSYLSKLPPDGRAAGAEPGAELGAELGAGAVVRVVPCGPSASAPGRSRGPAGSAPVLVTSFLDDSVTAGEITARHESVAEMCRNGVGRFADQIAGLRVVLRSKSPELVRQEIYAMLCTYHAVGHLLSPMHSADQLSVEARGRTV
ncbi:transposase domain-containing protein [Streptomyces sp. NPDC087270]|uniref:transposase domain-containing protein n=1 Tax=Streptomyces sp. NPDC087270 TaxID=3365774 RepID=UPI0038261ACD